MKKVFIFLFIFTSTLPVFSQRLATVGIMPFESAGVSADEAMEATRMVVAELSSWGTVTVLQGSDAENAEYIVRGRISRQNNQIMLSATTSERGSGRAMTASREQAPALGAISMESFCAQITEQIPFPNYLLGTWQSTINMVDGPIVSILEFRPNRTIVVHRFDTWEHNGANSLRYQGIGDGAYTYAGYRRRTVNIGGRQIQSDATVGINLALEDALPLFSNIRAGGLRVLFDDSRNTFELAYGGIPCGSNFKGTSVYPSENVFYTRFTKIQ